MQTAIYTMYINLIANRSCNLAKIKRVKEIIHAKTILIPLSSSDPCHAMSRLHNHLDGD